MKKPKDSLFPQRFSDDKNLLNNDIPRPKLKEDKKDELYHIKSFNGKLAKLFKLDSNNNIDDEKKRKIGIILTTVILLTLIISAYYFLIYQPAQAELTAEKTDKLNELHSLYKGPLVASGNAIRLEHEIEDANSAQEVRLINILMFSTKDWKNYHLKSINTNKDQYNRTMAVYENDTKNVIMPIDEATKIVNNHDAKVLSNIMFEKPNTVSVPILVSRLQAGAGLVSVGSVVDIYTNVNNTLGDTNNTNKTSPDVSGCTVLSIMRYEENGEIESEYSKGHDIVQGNNTNPNEDSQKFTSNVLEMLKGSIVNGYDEKTTVEMLQNYGIKLSNYERQINLGDLDAQYMLLIEVPQERVSYVLNNMDEIVLTIPTTNAPDWMVSEISQTYLNN